MKKLDLNMSVYNATAMYPEIIDIISKMGYTQIKNDFLLKTMGKTMSINQTIKKFGLDKMSIVRNLQNNGFECIG